MCAFCKSGEKDGVNNYQKTGGKNQLPNQSNKNLANHLKLDQEVMNEYWRPTMILEDLSMGV